MSPERVKVLVDGRELSLSNLDKVLYPAIGFTKGDVLDYYARVAGTMLPHLAGRPVTFKRFPEGVEGEAFFEKNVSRGAPSWLARVRVPRSGRAGSSGEIAYPLVGDRPSLIWAANLAALELHVPMWRVGDGAGLPKDPDLVVFDLDPGPGTSIVECCEVARWITGVLGDALVVAKTSGSKGLQLYLPAAGRSTEDSREWARDVAERVAAAHRGQVVVNMRRKLRERRVLIDWSQNSPTKTTVCVYSLRATPTATVSTPVTWSEVDRCARRGEPGLLVFDTRAVLERIERDGDLFAPLLGNPPAQPSRRGGRRAARTPDGGAPDDAPRPRAAPRRGRLSSSAS